MSRTYTFTVPGRPVPYLRMTQTEAAMAKRGKGKKAMQINRYWDWKTAAGWAAKAAGVRVQDGPVVINVRAYVYGASGDWDNYGKAAGDALQGIAYRNDREIRRGTAEVIPCKEGEQRMEIEIEYLEVQSA